MTSQASQPADQQETHRAAARLRDFPFPYRAMLAISTDIDGTTLENFREVHRFLNTRESTAMGEGVGLDVADSCWLFDAPGARATSMAYFRSWLDHTPNPAADELVGYIKAGWIDTLHTYGNYSTAGQLGGGFSRAIALKALEVFARHNLSLPVWTNHGDRWNVQNVGHGETALGDVPGSAAYHADLLPQFGIQYLWRQHQQRIAGHRSMIAPWPLRDGQTFFAFPRFTTHGGSARAASVGARFEAKYGRDRDGKPWIILWRPQVFHEQVADDILDHLEQNRHFSIVAQHLGFPYPMRALNRSCVLAFHRLRQRQDDGRILIARTSRLLQYNRVRDHLRFQITDDGEHPAITIVAVDDPVRGRWTPTIADLRGVTFEVAEPGRWTIRLGERLLPDAEIVRHASANGRGTLGIRWFTADLADHSRPFTARDGRTLLWSQEARIRLKSLGADIDAELETQAARTNQTPEWRAAIAYARDRYRADFDRYAEAMERIGFSALDAGLDIGCGAGHWCFAFLAHGARSVIGLDRSANYVGLCRDLAARFGFTEQARFVPGRGEELPFSDGRFNAAWSHGALKFGDVEKMLQEAARTLSTPGFFYCAFTGIGSRLLGIFTRLSMGDKERALLRARIVLNGYLNRHGVYHTDGGRVCMLETADLVRCTRVLGFTYVGEPRIQEQPGRFLAFEKTGDLVVQKTQPARHAIAQLAGGAALWNDWREDLQALHAAGCPGLVADVLDLRADWPDDDELRRLYALAVIRSGRARRDSARAQLEALNFAGLLDPYTLGLLRLDQGRPDTALACFQNMASTADRAFLVGMCHIARERWKDAGETFADGLRQAPANPALATGLVAACLGLGDAPAARATFAAMCRLNRGEVPADVLEEALALMEGQALAQKAPDRAGAELREEWWPRLSAG